MEITLERVKNLLDQGKSKEEVYSELIKAGGSVDMISAAFRTIELERSEENPFAPQAPVQAPTHSAPIQEQQVPAEKASSGGQKSFEDHRSRTITILLSIGAILIGAGIFSFIASNWQGMDSTVKVIIILIVVIGFNIAGLIVSLKTDLEKTAQALFLLGSLTYGAGIFLVAQIFNIRAEWPDGFLLWSIGVLPLAHVLKSGPLYFLGLLVAIIGGVGYPIANSLDIFRESFVVAGQLISDIILYITTIMLIGIAYLLRKEDSPDNRKYY